MLERLLLAAGLLLLALLAIQAGRWWYARRNAGIERRLRARAPKTSDRTATRPRIVYFTTQTCVICKAQQEPALAVVASQRSDIVIQRHDAVEEQALADEYGVLSVPTTAVYDGAGRLVTINRGFAPAALLLTQLQGADSAAR